MGARRARAAAAGGARALRRAGIRTDHGGGDRGASGTHRANVLPALRRQARGSVRRRRRAGRAPRQDRCQSARGRCPDRGGGSRYRSRRRLHPGRGRARATAPGIIAASAELQERELIKLASLASALAEALRGRGVTEPAASLAAEAGIAVFRIAFERWIDETDRQDLPGLMRESFDELRAVTAGAEPRSDGGRCGGRAARAQAEHRGGSWETATCRCLRSGSVPG